MVLFRYSLVVAEMCTASALISIGTILGKTSPVHLILVALLEVSGFVLNNWLLQTLLRVSRPSHDMQCLLCTLFFKFENGSQYGGLGFCF